MTRQIAAAVLERSGDHARPYADSAPLAVKTLDLADPRPGEVLVRIDAAGICHSDLSVINGDRPRPMPMALGHEASGTVLALGDPEEPGLAVGDRVVMVFLPSCGQCPQCHRGSPPAHDRRLVRGGIGARTKRRGKARGVLCSNWSSVNLR